MTVTVYVLVSIPDVTLTVRVFAPTDHEALLPLETVVEPFLISISASTFSATAVTLFVALVVVAVYDVVALSNVGVSASEPIVSLKRFALKGLSA